MMNTVAMLAAVITATSEAEGGELVTLSLFPASVEAELEMLNSLEKQLGEAPPLNEPRAAWREWQDTSWAVVLFPSQHRDVPGVPGYEYGPAEVYRDGRLHVAVYTTGTDKHVCEVEGDTWMDVHLAAHFAIKTITDEEAEVTP